jgi:hypothetical protein
MWSDWPDPDNRGKLAAGSSPTTIGCGAATGSGSLGWSAARLFTHRREDKDGTADQDNQKNHDDAEHGDFARAQEAVPCAAVRAVAPIEAARVWVGSAGWPHLRA